MMFPRPTRAVVGCVGLSAALGTVHAFSIFLEPLEVELDASRGYVSAIYSVALVVLTAGVLASTFFFERFGSAQIALGVGVLGAGGLAATAVAPSLWVALVGYGVIFGFANGIGYSFCLYVAAQSSRSSAAFAMALVTAVYALGASVAAIGLDGLVAEGGSGTALMLLAGVVGVAGLAAAALIGSRERLNVLAEDSDDGCLERPGLSVVRQWLTYGTAVFAGLMALGHVAPLVEEAGGSSAQGSGAIAIAGLASAAGGAGVAVATSRFDMHELLKGLPLVTAAALGALLLASTAQFTVASIAVVSLAYGATIAVFPIVVRDAVGPQEYPRVYARVFTAWGVAGLTGPVLAGAIFDRVGGYTPALLVACCCAVLSAGLAANLLRA